MCDPKHIKKHSHLGEKLASALDSSPQGVSHTSEDQCSDLIANHHLTIDSESMLSHEEGAHEDLTSPSTAVRACLLLIQLYRRYLSPLKPPSCRFSPTCSQYALDAYTHFGFFLGTWRTLTRLSRCHPWHQGGHDPVIKHAKNHSKKTK